MDKPVRNPAKPVVQHYHEMNVLRLGLISVQRQITKEENYRWSMEKQVGDITIKVECIGNPEYGIPHGQDSDFFNALVHLYIERGSPEDGMVTTTAYEILKVAGKPDNSHNYDALREALFRLNISQFYITRGWVNLSKKRWETVSFQHIHTLAFISDAENQLHNASLIQVTFPPAIVQSARAGYLMPTNAALVKSLSQPTSRGLYRLLEASRRDPDEPSKVVNVLSLNLMEWAQTCKLLTDRPGHVRRALAGAHQELTNSGYLREVTFKGRGFKQEITYLFNPGYQRTANPELVSLLVDRGIFKSVARDYALKYEDLVKPVVQRYEELLKGNYQAKNPSGLLISMLQNPDQYGVFDAAPALPEGKKPLQVVEVEAEPQPLSRELKLEFLQFMVTQKCGKDKALKLSEADAFIQCLTEGSLDLDEVYATFYGMITEPAERWAFEVRSLLAKGGLFH